MGWREAFAPQGIIASAVLVPLVASEGSVISTSVLEVDVQVIKRVWGILGKDVVDVCARVLWDSRFPCAELRVGSVAICRCKKCQGNQAVSRRFSQSINQTGRQGKSLLSPASLGHPTHNQAISHEL